MPLSFDSAIPLKVHLPKYEILMIISCVRVQGRPPQSILLWHFDCFEFKLRNSQCKKDILTLPSSPWNQEIDLPSKMQPLSTRPWDIFLSRDRKFKTETTLFLHSSVPKPECLCHFFTEKFIVSLSKQYKTCLL